MCGLKREWLIPEQSRMSIIHTYSFSTSCPLGYLHNGFMTTRALVRHVYLTCPYILCPMNCHEAIMVIAKEHVLRLYMCVYICVLKTSIETFTLLHLF